MRNGPPDDHIMRPRAVFTETLENSFQDHIASNKLDLHDNGAVYCI